MLAQQSVGQVTDSCQLERDTFLLLQPRPRIGVGCEASCTARDCSLILYAAAQESWVCSSLGSVGTPSGSGMGLNVQVVTAQEWEPWNS